MLKKIIKNFMSFGLEMSRNNSASYAASTAFFFCLSIFPALMFICSLTPYMPFTKADFVTMVTDLLPDYLTDSAAGIIDEMYSASSSILPITAVMTLWSAGMGILGLIRGLNGILGLEDKRNYFVLRALATVYTLLLLSVIIISLLLVVFGHRIADSINLNFPTLGQYFDVIIHFRSFIIWVILAIILDLSYAFLPAKNQKLIYQLPGAVFASATWCIITWGFSVYMDVFNGLSIYGNLTAIMVFLVWMYVCFNMVILGACINKFYKPVFHAGYRRVKKMKAKRKQSSKNALDAVPAEEKTIDNTI